MTSRVFGKRYQVAYRLWTQASHLFFKLCKFALKKYQLVKLIHYLVIFICYFSVDERNCQNNFIYTRISYYRLNKL